MPIRLLNPDPVKNAATTINPGGIDND